MGDEEQRGYNDGFIGGENASMRRSVVKSLGDRIAEQFNTAAGLPWIFWTPYARGFYRGYGDGVKDIIEGEDKP